MSHQVWIQTWIQLDLKMEKKKGEKKRIKQNPAKWASYPNSAHQGKSPRAAQTALYRVRATLTGWTHGLAPPSPRHSTRWRRQPGPVRLAAHAHFRRWWVGPVCQGTLANHHADDGGAPRVARAPGWLAPRHIKCAALAPFTPWPGTRARRGEICERGKCGAAQESRSRRRRGWSARLPALGRRQPSWVSPGTHRRCPCCRQANSVGETSPISRRDLQAAVNPPLVVSSFNQCLITGEIASNWLALSLRTCRTF
jgi:hypothetical protein